MNIVRSNLDDRIYFQAFVPHTGWRQDYEILLKYPFRKIEDYDRHDFISMRQLLGLPKPSEDPYVQ